MLWKIAADSSCDLPMGMDCAQSVSFVTVPLKLLVDGREFVDDGKLDVREMMAAMHAFKGASTSACPSPGDWEAEFESADCTIAITMTSALSGTYNSARVAKDAVLERHPEKKIHVIDTRSTSGSLILMAKKVNDLIASGLSFEEVVRRAEEYNRGSTILFTLATFDNLVKTGRMSRIAGMLASNLGIRAVARNTEEGKISVLHKARGESRILSYLVDKAGKLKDLAHKPVVITHCFNENAASKLKAMLEAAYEGIQVMILPTRGLTSFYADDQGILLCI